jgi:hypothetical protein
MTTTTQTAHAKLTGIIGRAWKAHDGEVVVIDQTPAGMVVVVRADGRRQQMRPSIVLAQLAKSEC